jgi:flagellar hook-basal body complex protein FliE
MTTISPSTLSALSGPAPLRPELPRMAPAGPAFTERLGDAINGLAEKQAQASGAAKAYELGERQDLAGVMIEQQVASLGFQLTLNVRNRALTAYRDIMNMSV